MSVKFDYPSYVEAFNRGDDATLIYRYFVPDFKFTGRTRRLETREEFLKFLQWAHDGVREIMHPITVLESEDRIFAEIDMDFIATKPRRDFPFGQLEVGDIMTVKFFVVYHLENGLVTELKSMTWPAEHYVSKRPLLGSSVGQRAAYNAYAQAFSAGDGARFGLFYTDDVVLDLPSGPYLEGRAAVVDFYSDMAKRVQETLTVQQLTCDDHSIAADLVSTFTAHEDAPDFLVKPLARGEAISLRVFVYYTLREGQICHIKVGRAGRPERL